MSSDAPIERVLRERLGDRLADVTLAAGETLFCQGDPADALYVVADGRLRVTQELAGPDGSPVTMRLGDLGPGELVGELGVLTAGRRTASVAAVEPSRLVRLSGGDVAALVETAPAIAERLAELGRRRLRSSQLAAALCRLLGQVDPALLEDIERRVAWVALKGGEVLVSAGEASRGVYILLSGRLRVATGEPAVARGAAAAGQRFVSEVAPGESVGEIALLTGEARTGEVRALRDSLLAGLSAEDFDAVRARHPQLVEALARVLIRRLRARERPRPAAQRALALAVVAAGPDVPLGDVAARLAAAFARLGPTLHLSRESLGRLTGLRGAADLEPGAPRSGWLAAWLDEQEARHAFLILEADASPAEGRSEPGRSGGCATPSAWTRRCVREADRALLVARAGSDPTECGMRIAECGLKSQIGNRKSEMAKPSILLLLHPQGTPLPSGTEAWLAAVGPDEHYHAREGRDDDFARLARCLAGRAVGLALGGGGARGLAHLGVARALRECGVPIDRVAGTSMGAIIAAATAMEMDYATELALGHRAFIVGRPHKEYTLPIVSLIRSRRLDRVLAMIYGEARIEDLWRPFACVSCNLTTAEMVTHTNGLLWKAVRASLAIPGIFTPVIQNGQLLVDGGVLNNLPGDVLRRAGCSRVIVVDVSPPVDLAVQCQEFPSPWRLLWRRLRRRAKALRVPSVLDILLRTLVISSEHVVGEVKRDADLCLTPPVTRYGMLQFEAMREIADAGYAYTRQVLDGPDRPPWLEEFTA